MKITWFGHSAFRLEFGDAVVLIDPFLSGNPSFTGDAVAAAAGATHVVLTHGHGDHVGDTVAIVERTGAKMDGASVYELIETEGVTFSAAVPTVWQGLYGHMVENGLKFSTLRKVLIGGSACPEALIRGFQDQFGVEVIHAWGMTETSPIGTIATAGWWISAISARSEKMSVSPRW